MLHMVSPNSIHSLPMAHPPLHEIVSPCRAGAESPGSQTGFLPPMPDPVGTVACWAAWETELSSAFFGNAAIEFVFLGKIRWRICFSLCARRQTRRRVKLRSVELMLQHHLLCGQLSPLYKSLSQESDTARSGPGKQRPGEGCISSVDFVFSSPFL